MTNKKLRIILVTSTGEHSKVVEIIEEHNGNYAGMLTVIMDSICDTIVKIEGNKYRIR